MRVRVKDIRKAYEKAFKENKKQFRFKGCDFLTSYAKYILEYLKDVVKAPDDAYVELQPQSEKNEKQI